MPEKPNDFVMSITVKFGPKFYEGKKHNTHKEIAAVLEEQAKRHHALEGLLSFLAKYHYRLEAGPHGPEVSGDSDSDSFTDYGPCTMADYKPGCLISVNGEAPTCRPC